MGKREISIVWLGSEGAEVAIKFLLMKVPNLEVTLVTSVEGLIDETEKKHDFILIPSGVAPGEREELLAFLSKYNCSENSTEVIVRSSMPRERLEEGGLVENIHFHHYVYEGDGGRLAEVVQFKKQEVIA